MGSGQFRIFEEAINRSVQSGTLIALAAAVVALTANTGNAQTRPMEGFDAPQQAAPKTDWSADPATSNQVDSVSQPTRFDVRSSIPDSRTGNERRFAPKPMRERGGALLDRLEQNQTPGRAAPITR